MEYTEFYFPLMSLDLNLFMNLPPMTPNMLYIKNKALTNKLI